jgi:hypothetical protein
MPYDPEMIKQRLAALSTKAPPLAVTSDDLRRRFLRKRRTHRGLITVGCTLLLGGAAASWPVLGAGESVSTSSTTPEATSTAMNGVAGGPALRCGDRITQQTINRGRSGFALRIAIVTRDSHLAPRVTVDIVSEKPVLIAMPGSVYQPRLAILYKGRVVAGQDAPRKLGQSVFNMPGGGQIVSPTRPYAQVVSPASPAPCPGFTWAQLWSSKSTLLVMMKAYPSQMATQRHWSKEHGQWISDQYLITESPLAMLRSEGTPLSGG